VEIVALLEVVTRSPQPAQFYSTNHYVEVDSQLCVHCGNCLKRCHLKARLMTNGMPSVDLNRCIGCGNCVVTCNSGATRLMTKVQKEIPPLNKNDMYRQMLSAKKA
jgi:MinD superfamily P-loop ATPase